MRKKKRLALILAAVAGIALLGFGLKYYRDTHIFLEHKAYPRNAESLDLRGEAVSVSHYEALRACLPDCEITWDVPFQGARYPEDTQALTVSSLSDEDIPVLDYFPMLKTLSAEDCRDYPQLASAKQRRPELTILYQVTVDGRSYPQDADSITIRNITDEEIGLLQYLPELVSIQAEDCTDLPQLQKVREARPDCRLSYSVPIAGHPYPQDTRELELTGVSVTDLAGQLPYLPEMEKVTLHDPSGSAEDLLALTDAFPDIAFFWDRDVLGLTVTSEDTEVDLSGYPLESPEPVKAAMEYFPNIEKVILCDCGLDNETMAAFREEMRAHYKVVWSVEVGRLTLRTDDTWYMPQKFGRGVNDAQSYNLRYCEDMVCIDVGHMLISQCEWAAFMPNLKYLIIADTRVSDLTPLTGLKNLIYLEMFLTRVRDYSPLLTCTAMEDLNLCYTHGDPEPVKQMTWLKRLWWAECPLTVKEFQEYLPDTQMVFLHHSSTGNGWRQGQNYYDMRDYLGVPYMTG